MCLCGNASGPEVGRAQGLDGQPQVDAPGGGQAGGHPIGANGQPPGALVPRAYRVDDIKNDVAGAGVAACGQGRVDIDQAKPQRVEGLDAQGSRAAGPPQQGVVLPTTADPATLLALARRLVDFDLTVSITIGGRG